LLNAYPGSIVQPLPFEEWVERLKASAEEAENDENIDIERTSDTFSRLLFRRHRRQKGPADLTG